MENYQNYVQVTKEQLLKAIGHLEYSYEKIQNLPTHVQDSDNETLETWESFCARFSRVSDIFMMKFVKVYVRADDPGFNGTFRDFMNQAEKLNLIDDVNEWMKIRELRNIASHDYSQDDLEKLFVQIKQFAPMLISLRQMLEKSK